MKCTGAQNGWMPLDALLRPWILAVKLPMLLLSAMVMILNCWLWWKKGECAELYFQHKISGTYHTEIWYIVFLLLYDFSFISILFSDVIFWFLQNILYKEIFLYSLRFGKIKKNIKIWYSILQYVLVICSLHKKYTNLSSIWKNLHKHSVIDNTIIWYIKNIL